MIEIYENYILDKQNNYEKIYDYLISDYRYTLFVLKDWTDKTKPKPFAKEQEWQTLSDSLKALYSEVYIVPGSSWHIVKGFGTRFFYTTERKEPEKWIQPIEKDRLVERRKSLLSVPSPGYQKDIYYKTLPQKEYAIKTKIYCIFVPPAKQNDITKLARQKGFALFFPQTIISVRDIPVYKGIISGNAQDVDSFVRMLLEKKYILEAYPETDVYRIKQPDFTRYQGPNMAARQKD